MRRPGLFAAIAAVCITFLSAPALAAPADPALQKEALAIFEKWNKAVNAGRLQDGLPLRTAKFRAEVAAESKTAAKRREMMDMLRAMTPETVEVTRATLSGDGQTLTLYTIIGKSMPKGVTAPGAPPAGTKLRNELTLEFVREGGAWKFGTQHWGMDPDKIKPCASVAFEGIDSFDSDRDMQMGGQIRRVAFEADHTMVVIRMFDEEACIFMPSKAKLSELGLNTDLLQAWALIEIDAWPHRTDKQRVWAEGLKVTLED